MEIELHLESVVEDDSGDLGEFRNKNKPGQTHRRLLIDTPRLSLKIALLHHGSIRPGGKAASLLVFDFRLTPSQSTKRFKSASFEVLFRDTLGDNLKDPEVYRISPEGTFAINPWTLSTNVKHILELGGNIGLPQGALNLNMGRESEQERTAEFSMELTGRASERERGFGEANHVLWEMKEDEKRRMGTPTFLRTAVILSREERRSFTCSFKADIDAKTTLSAKTAHFFARTGREEERMPVDDVTIDPRKDTVEAQDKDLAKYEENVIVWDNLHELNLQADAVQHTTKGAL